MGESREDTERKTGEGIAPEVERRYSRRAAEGTEEIKQNATRVHQISEIIADMHLSDYIRHGGCEEDFYTGELTQYPSHDQVLFFIDL